MTSQITTLQIVTFSHVVNKKQLSYASKFNLQWRYDKKKSREREMQQRSMAGIEPCMAPKQSLKIHYCISKTFHCIYKWYCIIVQHFFTLNMHTLDTLVPTGCFDCRPLTGSPISPNPTVSCSRVSYLHSSTSLA